MITENSPRFMHNSIENTINGHINLLHIGWEKCMPGYTYVNHRNIYLVHYVKTGKGFLQVDNKKIHLNAGDVFLIRPKQLATYTADADDPWQYYYFAFNGDLSETILSRTCFSSDKLCFSLKNSLIAEYISDAVNELNDPSGGVFSSLEYLFKFLKCIEIIPQSSEEKIAHKENHYITTLEEYIMFNYPKPLKVSELAKMVNLNRSHLHKVFKKNTGKSIEEFVIYVRIQEAKRFLRETEFSVNDIARFVGYNNYPSFFRMFKAMENITPSEYRSVHKQTKG